MKALLPILALCLGSCVIPGKEAIKDLSEPRQNTNITQGSDATSGQGLIKPTIPPAVPPKAAEAGEGAPVPTPIRVVVDRKQSSPLPQQAQEDRREGKQAPPQPRPEGELQRDKKQAPTQPRQEWEDQRVRAAALELARTIPNVQKIKVCYLLKYDEWWATFYEDIGSLLELRQFVWSREQERFQPHLVQVRIAKSALAHHAAESEPDQACEALDAPPVTSPPPPIPQGQATSTDLGLPK